VSKIPVHHPPYKTKISQFHNFNPYLETECQHPSWAPAPAHCSTHDGHGHSLLLAIQTLIDLAIAVIVFAVTYFFFRYALILLLFCACEVGQDELASEICRRRRKRTFLVDAEEVLDASVHFIGVGATAILRPSRIEMSCPGTCWDLVIDEVIRTDKTLGA
jgi:hypothetical protein